jgi:hypothetical protein
LRQESIEEVISVWKGSAISVIRGVETYPIPIVSQQNQRSTVVIPSFFVWNKGTIRSVENEDSFRLTISRVESF